MLFVWINFVPTQYYILNEREPSWWWSYGSSIYNALFNQWLSPLMLWAWIPLRVGVLDSTLCDEICQWLAADRWFSPGTLVSSTNKTDLHDIVKILLKVESHVITITIILFLSSSQQWKELPYNIHEDCFAMNVGGSLWKKITKIITYRLKLTYFIGEWD
jgi:hypothetical protein